MKNNDRIKKYIDGLAALTFAILGVVSYLGAYKKSAFFLFIGAAVLGGLLVKDLIKSTK